MKRAVTRTALGFVTIAIGLAISAPASAQFNWTRWQNADTSRGTFYLSVSGGQVCSTYGTCGLQNNTAVVTYQWAGQDQVWNSTYSAPVTSNVENFLPDYRSPRVPVCLATSGNNSTAAGAALVVYDCQDQSQGPGQYWQIQSAASLGAPYQNCYAFVNQNGNHYVMSVRNAVVQNGSVVDQYPLCVPNSGACGNPSDKWHPDQFWCPIPD